MGTSTQEAAVLFEEGSSQPENLCQKNGVRVQGGSDAAQHLEDMRCEICERVTLGTEVRREGWRSRLCGLWSITVNEESEDTHTCTHAGTHAHKDTHTHTCDTADPEDSAAVGREPERWTRTMKGEGEGVGSGWMTQSASLPVESPLEEDPASDSGQGSGSSHGTPAVTRQ